MRQTPTWCPRAAEAYPHAASSRAGPAPQWAQRDATVPNRCGLVRRRSGVVWHAFCGIKGMHFTGQGYAFRDMHFTALLQYRVARDRLELGVVHAVRQHELERHVRHEALRVHVPVCACVGACVNAWERE